MESSNLTIVLHCGKCLKNVKHLGTMRPYAIAWIDGDSSQPKHQTNTARNGGSDPKWEYFMEFNNVCKNKKYILVIQVKHDGTIVDRNIGEVKVPFADLLAGDGSGMKVSYQMEIPSGEKIPKGEVIVSHKFSDPQVAKSSEEDGNYDTGTSSNGDGEGSPGTRSMKERAAKMIAKKVLTKAATGIAVIAAQVSIESLLD